MGKKTRVPDKTKPAVTPKYDYSPERLTFGELNDEGVLVIDTSKMSYDQRVEYFMKCEYMHEYNAHKFALITEGIYPAWFTRPDNDDKEKKAPPRQTSGGSSTPNQRRASSRGTKKAMPMNPQVKQQWLEALRSGEYKKGRFRLKDSINYPEVRYSPLGVLTDLAVKAGVVTWVEDHVLDEEGYAWDLALPPQVQRWAGLSSDNPKIKLDISDEEDPFYYAENLLDFNSRGKTFNEIADLIEEHL